MPGNFDGKTALVTGASSGIGRACAIAFAEKGAKVIVSDVDAAGGEETVRLIKAMNGEARFVICDVSKSSDVEALMRTAVQSYSSLDFACNNAGIEGVSAATADYPEEVWNRVISINLTGVWLCTKYEIQQMPGGCGCLPCYRPEGG